MVTPRLGRHTGHPPLPLIFFYQKKKHLFLYMADAPVNKYAAPTIQLTTVRKFELFSYVTRSTFSISICIYIQEA